MDSRAPREDGGEIEAALEGRLPGLVTTADIRGDLHTHTNLTNGLACLEEMTAAVAARGYAYYAVTDHAPNLYMQRMTEAKALEQREQVRRLDSAFGGMRSLDGIELNIDLTHRHDQVARPNLREPVRQHHRPSGDPAHRQGGARRRRLAGGVRGLRPHRHRSGDQRVS